MLALVFLLGLCSLQMTMSFNFFPRLPRAGKLFATPDLSTSNTPVSPATKAVVRIEATQAKKAGETAGDFVKRSNIRRKMGPPQRKLSKTDEDKLTGRVSVYCVGSGIDLQALRAHIFRRGFGAKSTPELTLPRGSTENEIDDEVLHVSNAPLFIYAAQNGRTVSTWHNPVNAWASAEQTDDGQQSENKQDIEGEPDQLPATAEENGEPVTSLNAIADSEAMSWKTKETLVMATQDVFYFDYGCVVCWGLSPAEEKAVLTELQPFAVEPVTPKELEDSFDTMEFTFDRTANPQRPIKFDRMKLRSLRTEEKLALSYAMAQSSKLFVFESKVLQSVERTRYLPKELAKEGKISCSKKELNSLIGQLFVEQTEVNLFSSILDTPDFLWDDDEYFPTYQYCRSYLEVDDRVQLLNSRLAVIRDLLDVLNAQVADSNSTRLEWIVIWLIAIEIVMGIASSPLFAGKRVVAALLVPTAILLYKKLDWGLEK